MYLVEEMSKLAKELCKERRRKGDPGHIKEGLAHVLCSVLAYSVSMGLDFGEIREIMLDKFDGSLLILDKGER